VLLDKNLPVEPNQAPPPRHGFLRDSATLFAFGSAFLQIIYPGPRVSSLKHSLFFTTYSAALSLNIACEPPELARALPSGNTCQRLGNISCRGLSQAT